MSLGLILCGLGLPQAQAQPRSRVQPGSLWAAWLAARRFDPQFREARARLAATRTRRPAALAGLLPRLSLDADRLYTNAWSVGPEFYGSSLLTVEQSENTSQSYWTVTLTQPLFSWTAIEKLASANAAVAAAGATYTATRMALMRSLVRRYLAVLVAQSQLLATRKTERAFAIEAEQARARHKAGLRGIIGFEEARSAEASAQARVIDARRELRQALSSLAELTGPSFRPDLAARTSSIPLIPLPPLRPRQWVHAARLANPVVVAARLKARSAHAEVSAARGGYWPSIRVQVSHTRNLTGGTYGYAVPGVLDLPAPAANTAQQNLILLNLHWNFYAGGGTNASVDRAADEYTLAREQAARAALRSEAQAERALSALHADFADLHAYEESVVAAHRAVTATQDGVKAGLRSEFDLVNARLALLSAETHLPQVQAAVINDALALESTAGLLTPLSLLTLSKMFQSETGMETTVIPPIHPQALR